MKSTLKALFDEGIYPFEEIVPNDPEYRTVNRQISEEKQYFIQVMSLDDARRFEGLGSLCSRSASIYARDCFIYGFRLGALLMGEVFTEEG